MKTVWSGAGVDNTANAKLWLLQNRTMYIQDLYQIGPAVPTGAPANSPYITTVPILYQWTDADYPIKSTYLGATFYPERIKRGSLKYKIGTQTSDLQFDLYTQDTQQPWRGQPGADISGTPQPINDGYQTTDGPRGYPPYQDSAMNYKRGYDGKGGWGLASTLKTAFTQGDMQGLPFSLYRAFMSTPGDADSIGVCQMFSGWIGKVEISRSKISVTVSSMMQLFQNMIPSQLIEPGDRGWSYNPRLIYDYAAQVESSSTINYIDAIFVSGPAGNYVGNGSDFDDGWMIYEYDAWQSDVAPWLTTRWNAFYTRRIRQGILPASPTNSSLRLYLYEPLPLPPWRVSIEHDTVWLWKKSGLNNGDSPYGQGFPYVPPPEAAV